jgi:hypothetical protein
MSHPNSADSLKQVDREKRYEQILDALECEQRPMTDREVMRYLRFSDPNMVRPRIKELIDQGRLREGESVKCKETGRTVRTVALVNGRLF